MTKPRWVLLVACLALLGSAGLFAFLAWFPALPPIAALPSFDARQVARGATLAAIGDCAVCHTQPGHPALAGGRDLTTPFGAIVSTNITPDRATGIGTWSADAFRRAMQKGIDRSGQHLYPAFPYDHFREITDPDLDAIYAWLMTRPAVQAAVKPTTLAFPYNLRPLITAWNLRFLQKPGFWRNPAQDDQWNRGFYLAEAVAHCSACHSPRDRFGAEINARAYSGGAADGWTAPSLTVSSPAPVPWTADSLFTYLRTGIDAKHGAAAGPMAPVIEGLAKASDADIHAIATYIASLSDGDQARDPAPPANLASVQGGAAIFAGACAACHGTSAMMAQAGRPSLADSTALHADDPIDAVRTLLEGLQTDDHKAGLFMPSFAKVLTDAQLSEVLAYARARFAPAHPAWTALTGEVAKLRAGDS